MDVSRRLARWGGGQISEGSDRTFQIPLFVIYDDCIHKFTTKLPASRWLSMSRSRYFRNQECVVHLVFGSSVPFGEDHTFCPDILDARRYSYPRWHQPDPRPCHVLPITRHPSNPERERPPSSPRLAPRLLRKPGVTTTSAAHRWMKTSRARARE